MKKKRFFCSYSIVSLPDGRFLAAVFLYNWIMTLEQLRQFTPQLMQIARKHGITKIYVFGSAARGDSSPASDVDFLVEMQEGASLFGAAGFGYEAERLLGRPVDVLPLSALSRVEERDFVVNVTREAVSL